jgi:hypothetical protein
MIRYERVHTDCPAVPSLDHGSKVEFLKAEDDAPNSGLTPKVILSLTLESSATVGRMAGWESGFGISMHAGSGVQLQAGVGINYCPFCAEKLIV